MRDVFSSTIGATSKPDDIDRFRSDVFRSEDLRVEASAACAQNAPALGQQIDYPRAAKSPAQASAEKTTCDLRHRDSRRVKPASWIHALIRNHYSYPIRTSFGIELGCKPAWTWAIGLRS